MNRYPGKFITFEGIDKTGKSTQSEMLVDYLTRQNIPVIKTREPGGTKAAEAIRELVMNTPGLENTTECLLMLASRRENLYKKIIPALKKGTWVVCDRFNDSTLAYQGAKIMSARNDFSCVVNINKMIKAAGVNYEPDATIYMSASLKEKAGLESSDDIYEKRDDDYYSRVSQIYKHLAQKYPRIIEISALTAQGTVLSPESISKTIVEKINKQINGNNNQRGGNGTQIRME